jgi:hypothetical protein
MDNLPQRHGHPPTPDRARQLDMSNNANFLVLRHLNSNAMADQTNRTYIYEEKNSSIG